MKQHIDSICDSWLSTLQNILETRYQNEWNEVFQKLYSEAARRVIEQLNFTYRCDPEFQIAEDLSNLMNSGYLPGTDDIGNEIQSTVIKRFGDHKQEFKKKSHE